VIVEPTGVYHKLLLRIAVSFGFETALVDASHVKKMRSVIFGDTGKTDERDPVAIEAVAAQGRIIEDRRHTEVYQLLRQWGKLHHDAEVAMIDAKSRVHRAMTLLFPDFDFTTDFLYGPSGQAIFRCFGMDPHAIAAQNVSRMYERLRKQSRIQRSSVVRLLAQARQTIAAVSKSRVTDLQVRVLAYAWEDVEFAIRRRETARAELETLYDEARASDRRLPETTGSAISKVAFARFLGETGPLSGYASWRQLMRVGGVNLRERKSGKYVGKTMIARTGRALFRAIINQMALPLVKRDRLYGTYYHHKTGVQKMPGKKAMTAVSRKIVKMIRSAGASSVHVRISSPPIQWPCYYGIDTPTRKELIGSSHSVEEICRYLAADSLGYLSLDGMLKATGSDPGHFCHACFTGAYRVGIEPEPTPQLPRY